MEQLSSSATTFLKIVFPLVWLTGFGVGTVAVMMTSGSDEMSGELALMFPLGGLVGLLLFAVLCFPLKHVSLEGSNLRVRGLKKVAVIPLAEVVSVSSSFLLSNPETITLRFRHPTVFGFSIKFTPYHRIFRFKTHPTTMRLMELVAAATRDAHTTRTASPQDHSQALGKE